MSSGFLQDARRHAREGRHWAGLPADALAYVLSQQPQARVLLVTDAADQAQQLARALRFFAHEPERVALLPADDVRPYDGFSPDGAVVRTRICTLEQVAGGGPIVVVAPAVALVQRLPTAAVRAAGSRVLTPDQQIGDRDQLRDWLSDAGYLAVGQVTSEGCFAVRGDVIDVWPSGLPHPVRVDLFDDEVESLRRIDPSTQRTHGSLQRVQILPAREDRHDADALSRLGRCLAVAVREQNRGVRLSRRVRSDLAAGVRFSGLEDYLSGLVDTAAPLELLAGLHAIVFGPDDVFATLRDHSDTALRRWQALDDDERPLLGPDKRLVRANDVIDTLSNAQHAYAFPTPIGVDLGARLLDGFEVKGAELGPVVKRLEQLAAADLRVALVADTPTRGDRLIELIEPHGLRLASAKHPSHIEAGRVTLLYGDLPRGFIAKDSGLAFLPAVSLFGGHRDSAREARVHALFDAAVSSMAQLKEGDLVVHRRHGVGRYEGLRRVAVLDSELRRFAASGYQAHDEGAIEQDFVRVVYRGGDLLLPVTALSQLSRYTPGSGGGNVRLDKLGGVSWEARKGKVRDALLRMAQELLQLYAKRELASREPLPPLGPMSTAFAARFPHQETPDQALAIDAIQADLSRTFPMDRLLCGDVGFGKTEVAMRAVMRVVESGGQAAVLCPTTVLAYQHVLTFRDRFAGFPVRIGLLCRFNTPAEDTAVIEALRNGELDIVIGTTALLARRVRFADLQLVVLDEEHRFGVRQKERLKKLRTEVHVLAMSATPIPRTLQMALGGVREMSLMATPPAERLAVRTSLARMTESRVRDAIRSELSRGGQVFFVHNRVETIERVATTLREWMPEVRFAVGHGQMDDVSLERVLVDFVQQRSDVLVCTAIVESGVDIPNVNTMLVDRADRFGLAQLYQLRGRVGRSSVRARCLLLIPDDISNDARKRLQVVVDHSALGAGYHIATADLELRGGGNLLGKSQSGNINKVGFETWVELLDEAVHDARGEHDVACIEPEVEVPVPAFLPDLLLHDVAERLGWYKRFAEAASTSEVGALLEELEDRAGELPEPVHNLAGLAITRIECRALGVVSCRWLKVRARLELHPSSVLSDARLAQVQSAHPKRFSLEPDGEIRRLSVRFTPHEAKRPFRFLRWLFAQLRNSGG